MAVLLRPVTSADDPVLDRITDFYADARDRAALLLSVWPLPDLVGRGWQLAGHPMFVVRAPGPVTATRRATASRCATSRPSTTCHVLERRRDRGLPARRGQGRRPPGTLFPDAAARLRRSRCASAWSTASRSRARPRSTPTASSTSASPRPSPPAAARACGRRWCGRG